MTLVNVNDAILKTLCKRSGNKWHVCTLTIGHHGTVRLVKVHSSLRFGVDLEPSPSKAEIVLLLDLRPSIDEDSYARMNLGMVPRLLELPQQTLLTQSVLRVRVHHANIAPVTVFQKISQYLGVAVCQLREIVLFDGHGQLMTCVICAGKPGGRSSHGALGIVKDEIRT
jgi:hypothetical protein